MNLTRNCVLLALVSLLLGCGGNSLPTPIKVKGKVVYQSAPVADAVVTFHPDKAPSPSSGTTNAAGEFELMTYARGDGAFPGHHKVTVAEKPGSAPTATSIDGADYEKAMEAMVAEKAKPMEKPRFPAKYGSFNSTDLEFDVKADGVNQATLKLKD